MAEEKKEISTKRDASTQFSTPPRAKKPRTVPGAPRRPNRNHQSDSESEDAWFVLNLKDFEHNEDLMNKMITSVSRGGGVYVTFPKQQATAVKAPLHVDVDGPVEIRSVLKKFGLCFRIQVPDHFVTFADDLVNKMGELNDVPASNRILESQKGNDYTRRFGHEIKIKFKGNYEDSEVTHVRGDRIPSFQFRVRTYCMDVKGEKKVGIYYVMQSKTLPRVLDVVNM